MTGMRGALLVFAAAGALASIASVRAEDDDPAVPKELAALQGRWERNRVLSGSAEVGDLAALIIGKSPKKDGPRSEDVSLTIKDDVFTFAGMAACRATAELKPKAAPKRIDLVDPEGRIWRGVYEHKGDELKFTFSDNDEPPAAVADEPKSSELCVRFTRVNVDEKGVVVVDDPAVRKELAALQGRWQRQGVGEYGSNTAEASKLFHGGRVRVRGEFPPEDSLLEVEKNVFTFGGAAEGRATALIGASRTPKTIDLTDSTGRVMRGVYELKGSELRMTFGLTGDRPSKVAEGKLNETWMHYARPKGKTERKKRK